MKTDVSTENLKKGAYWTIILVGAVFSLIYFRSFLEPIVLALLVWYLIRTTRKYIAKLTIGGRSLPQWLQRVVAFLLTVSFIYGVYQIISVNISLITANSDSYDKNGRIPKPHEIETCVCVMGSQTSTTLPKPQVKKHI